MVSHPRGKYPKDIYPRGKFQYVAGGRYPKGRCSHGSSLMAIYTDINSVSLILFVIIRLLSSSTKMGYCLCDSVYTLWSLSHE